ncbi:RAC family serine/threonine-protein kinase like protein [Tritrichomonas foetus]|uniref:RAC family serine/threonine-protein kinase like protein n=1 Tax=Tritrichomonas foetus TaxID=1144522 RepID=A0A1J4L0A5_9EUKA|nr:RAC family serine/threonine-protein kinase like protein [Tritrichomonas foetus]|eukprot:OHT16842.1 RAC family serine/threonine-protein kinase like protein [Tritrichomonas foetus]
MDSKPLSIASILSLEGFLNYKSFDGPWITCFCQISGYTLDIYVDETMEQKLEIIDIDSKITAILDDINPLAFSIYRRNKKIADFLTTSIEEAMRWSEIIKSLTTPQPSLSMDDFKIISCIGRGYFGKVMLVQNKQTNELFAIKAVPKKRLIESGRPRTIIAERNIMMLVKYPFIVQLHFAFQTKTKFYLGLEYAPGGELFYHMEQIGLIPIDDARLYVAEIALALDHLHKYGFVYRDLKLENVLFDSEGHVKLTDFGLAKEIYLSNTKTFCGSNHYLAPEIVLGQPYSFEIDWWALGILLCEMLTGVTPFSGENRMQMFESIAHDKPILPSAIDEEAGSLILWLLTKDPKQRPKFAQISQHPFFDCLNWEYVVNRRYRPNFVPEQSTCCEDTLQYFAPEFTQEAAIDSQYEEIPNETMNVTGFSFIAPSTQTDYDYDSGSEFSLDGMLLHEYEQLAAAGTEI